MTKLLPLLTARYTILFTRRLQPPRDNFAVRVQWLSSVVCVFNASFWPRKRCKFYLNDYKTMNKTLKDIRRSAFHSEDLTVLVY